MARLISLLALLLCVGCMEADAWMNTAIIGGGVEAAAGGDAIDDDFESDTSANYTAITNDMVRPVADGNAHGSTNWANNIVYHETELSSDHWIKVTAEDGSVGGLIGYDSAGDDGYVFYVAGAYSQVKYVTNGAIGSDACNDVNIPGESAPFLLEASWNGADDMDLWINGTQYVTDCDPGTTYSGTYVGLMWKRTSGTNYYTDDLTADDN